MQEKYLLPILGLTACLAMSSAFAQDLPQRPNSAQLLENGKESNHPNKSPILTWATIPTSFELMTAKAFRLPTGETHWYQTVYLPKGGVNWVQASELAEKKGGYLVSIHSQEENDFVFSLVTDKKFWWKFPHGNLEDGTPIFNLSGPFLGGFQPDGSVEPSGGWRWVSGEPMTWLNWQHEGLDIGVHIQADNQPNDSRGQQNVMAFGEVDLVASYWSDVPHLMGTFNSPLPSTLGFIIEYETDLSIK